MSQQTQILNILADHNWHCSNEFYAAYIADPRSRISALKKIKNFNGKQVYNLEWRWCTQHTHNKSKQWRLVENNSLSAQGTKQSDSSDTRTTGQGLPPVSQSPIPSQPYLSQGPIPENGIRTVEHNRPLLELPF